MASIFSNRKMIALGLAGALALCLLSGCAKRQSNNTVRPMELSEDQQVLFDLMSVGSRDTLLFDYQLGKGYTAVELSVLIYQGTSREEVSRLVSPLSADDRSGTMVVAIENTTAGYHWTLSAAGGSLSTIQATPPFGSTGQSVRSIEEPVEIQPDEPFYLYVSCFSNGPMSTYDVAEYQAKPELFGRYDYAHVIQCRFLAE